MHLAPVLSTWLCGLKATLFYLLTAHLFSFTDVYFHNFCFCLFFPSVTVLERGAVACGDLCSHSDDRRAMGVAKCPNSIGCFTCEKRARRF